MSRFFTSLILLALSLLLVTGCSSSDGDSSSGAFTTLATATARDGFATVAVAPAGSSLAGAEVSLPAGVVPAGGKVGITTAPAQSVNDSAFARIGATARFYAKDASGAAITDFGGSNATVTIPFSQAQLEADLNAVPSGQLLLFRTSDTGGAPESIPFDLNVGSVTAQTNHFSLFFLMRRRVNVSSMSLGAISPSNGNENGGTLISISGSGFVGGTSVTIGGNAATNVSVLSTKQITCVTPAGVLGAADVVVQSPFDSVSRSMGFTYTTTNVPPTLTSINPTMGPLTGGSFTLTGTGFSFGPVGVAFGGSPIASFGVINDTTISGEIPATSTAGAVTVSVSTAHGTAMLTNGFTYVESMPAPTVTEINPTTSPLAGGTTFVLTGTGFSAQPITVTFGGIDAGSLSVGSDTSLSGTIPASLVTGAVDIVVTTPNGSGSLPAGLTYEAAAPSGTGTWENVVFNGRPAARTGHGMVQASGTAYIFGGTGGGSLFYNDMWTYDSGTDTFAEVTMTGDVPDPGHSFSMVSFFDSVAGTSKFALWGGWRWTAPSGPEVRTNSGSIYNVTTMAWTSMSTLNAPDAREDAIFDYVGNNQFLVWGGGQSFNARNDGAIYDLTSDTWTAVSATNAPMDRTQMTWSTDTTARKVYAFGGVGSGGSVYYNDLYEYDVASNMWTLLSGTGAPAGRTLGTMVLRSSKLFVWGGNSLGGELSDGGIFDIAGGAWTATSSANSPSSRFQFVTVNTGSGIVIWAGNSIAGIRQDGYLFDIDTNTWTPLNTNIYTPPGVSSGEGVYVGKMIVFGGRTSTWTNLAGRLGFP